jgi:hypothetical protein
MPQPRAGIIYQGPSMIDGQPIVAIAVHTNSNRKTGPVLQTYILRRDIAPIDAVKTGDDASICGGCLHRGDGTGKGRTCYVTLFQGPRVVYASYMTGNYPDASNHATRVALGTDRVVRLGTYGDPAAVPVAVWRDLLTQSVAHTGYTHQWRAKFAAGFAGLVLASCDNERDRGVARSAGWGTFTVVPQGATVRDATLCPASAEAGKGTTCADCRKCDGNPAADVYIPAHGASGMRYTGTRKRKNLTVLA